MTQTGGCLCGKVRYEIEGEPAVTAVCHCTHCQKQSGSAFSVNLLVPDSRFKLDGDVQTYEDTGESGQKVHRRFCSRCGSPILSVLDAVPGMVAIKAGTLDADSSVRPMVQVWCDSKQDWLDLAGDIPGFGKNAPAG